MTGRALVVGVLLAGSGVAGWLMTGSSSANSLPPSVEGGRELAARWCADCHVVAASGAGTDAAPSFTAIAARSDAAAIRAFLAQPHAQPMQGFSLSSREIGDVAAYMETLRGPSSP